MTSDAVYESVPTPDPFHCLEFSTGVYGDFFGNYPYPTNPIWFTEKNSVIYWGPESNTSDNHMGSESTQMARWAAFPVVFIPEDSQRLFRG